VSATLDWAEHAARQFEVKPRRWATPGLMAVELDPSTRQTPALELIDAELVKVAEGHSRRLMVFMPPQEGKSQRVSRRFPTWLLEHDPTLRIGIVSYEKELAVRWGRDIKLDLEMHPELGIDLRKDSQAAGRWQTVQGGGVYCVGIGGALTGQPIDVLIIDDPLKGRAEAESETYRQRAWDWWENVGSTRLSRRGAVVLMMTRWHTDDMAGRFKAREPREWRTVSVPAIATSDDDPTGRRAGQELVSATKDPGWFVKTKSLRSPYVWASVYQQNPTTAEGNIFKRGDWQFWQPLDGNRVRLDGDAFDLADAFRYITIDLATSLKTSADWTVATVWAVMPTGDLLVLDRKRERVPELDHAAFVAPLRQRWLQPFDVTHVESRMFGTRLVYAMGEAGVPIAELHADVDKLTRALPYAGLVRQKRVWLPADAPWLDEWLDEHADFPNTKHDDQVDTGAYGARVALDYWAPASADGDDVYDDDLGYERVSIGPDL
jgi:predicted phage terminase large subunit-like protein